MINVFNYLRQHSLLLILVTNAFIIGFCFFKTYLQANFNRISYLEDSMALIIVSSGAFKWSASKHSLFLSQKELSLTEKFLENDKSNVVIKQTANTQGALKYLDLDKTGRPDFALESLGGQIVRVKFDKSRPWYKRIFVNPFKVSYSRNPPRRIIQPSVFPGECFSFNGKTSIVIKLMGKIFIDAVSLEHIPLELSPDKKNLSAPKEFLIFGLLCPDDQNPFYFGNFFYNRDADPVQTFNFERKSPMSFPFINVTFVSNQGDVKTTCVYR